MQYGIIIYSRHVVYYISMMITKFKTSLLSDINTVIIPIL